MTAFLAPALLNGKAFLASAAPPAAASTVSSVTVAPGSATVAGGATQQFTATVAGTGTPSQAVTWSRSPTVGTIGADGLYTAAATSMQQTVTITATSQQDPTKSGSATVTIPALGVDPGPDPDPEVPDSLNYAWLQTEVLGWMRRPDLASLVPKFIALAEAELSPRLQARGIEVVVPIDFAPGVGAKRLPSGFSSPLAAWLEGDSGPRKLTGVVPEQLSGAKDRGEPAYWAIDGTYLALDRPAARTQRINLRYRGLLRLSDEAPNNSVLSKYHNVYLYGALKYSALHIRDFELASTWSQLYESAIKEMNRNESRSRAIAPLRTELAGLVGCR